MSIKKEEYTALGDFIKTSFTRDQPFIAVRYPKMNAAYLAAFGAKLEEVRTLETSDVITGDQKKVTKSLYDEAEKLNKELVFLCDYFAEAGLDDALVSNVRKDLARNNIEGAVLKIESVLQVINANKPALMEEGMVADFPSALRNHKESLASKNSMQNQHMNSGKDITESSKVAYEELYDFISKIADTGKKVFKGTKTEEEYTLSLAIKRMRSDGEKK